MAVHDAHTDRSDEPDGGAGHGRPTVPVAIGAGSNLGDRRRNLARGCAGLSRVLDRLRCSRVYETEPVGGEGDHGRYLNLCCVGRTGLGPRTLLDRLLDIEAAAGRDRTEGTGPLPRTLDLDLLLYGDEVVDEPGLRVPHPRMRRRAFVLVPLAEIAGSWRDPETGRAVADLAEAVDASGVEPYRGDLPEELEAVIRR